MTEAAKGQYLASPPTLANGATESLQLDAQGRLVVNVGAGGGTATPPTMAGVVSFQIAVGSSATRLTASATVYAGGFRLSNRADSTASLFYGPSGVTTGGATPGAVSGASTAGDEIAPGASVVFPPGSPSLIYVIATTSGTAVACVSALS